MNFALPKRRKRERMAHKEASVIRCALHLQFIRGHECCASNVVPGGTACSGNIEAAHVRVGGNGGTGMKPGDDRTIPLCSHHHREQHQIGEGPFERMYGIDMAKIAAAMWDKSKPGQRYRANHTPPEEARHE